jgi:hypothetical protein
VNSEFQERDVIRIPTNWSGRSRCSSDAERHDRVSDTAYSYSIGPGFKSRQRDRL